MYSIYYWPLFLTSHSCTFSILKLVKLFKHWPYFSIAFQCVVSSGMSFPKLFICQTSSSSLNVSLCFTFFASPQYYSGYQFMCSKSILCILLPLHLLLCCDDELIIFVLQQNVYWTERETFLSPVMSTLNKFLLNEWMNYVLSFISYVTLRKKQPTFTQCFVIFLNATFLINFIGIIIIMWEQF